MPLVIFHMTNQRINLLVAIQLEIVQSDCEPTLTNKSFQCNPECRSNHVSHPKRSCSLNVCL
jgi:hypothetical protein